ncbi:MAG: aminotransferase class V-fold PLP-dependent enzyme [Cyclobacteriaceae bacterium]
MNIDPSHFPILQEYTYLNTARFCALPNAAIEIQQDFLSHLQTHGSWQFDPWTGKYEECRALVSEIVQVSTEHVFFLPNVSLGFNMAAQYLPKRPVITLSSDFPSVNMAWAPHGFKVTAFDHRSDHFFEEFENALNTPEQIVAISWIQSADGFEIDLKWLFEICKKNNHLLVLDGTQGFAALEIEVDPEVNLLLLASGFKWSLAGYGIAIGYLAPSIAHYFAPMRGWFSVDFENGGIKKGANHLEVGNASYLNVFALLEGLKIIKAHGLVEVENWNAQLAQYFMNNTDREVLFPKSRSSIKSFTATKVEYDRLVEAKIQATWQNGRIRISPHFYNTIDDIDRVIAILNS